jgi:uncharacterized SAM-binding protein YcdF (DUF218 family)
MFFILSKVFSIVLNPIVWIAWLGWRLFRASTPRQRTRRFYWLIGSVLVLTNPLLYRSALMSYETKYEPVPAGKIYEIGVVLGGFSEEMYTDDRCLDLNLSGDRIVESARLWHAGKVKKILISGGSGALLVNELEEATFASKYLISLGIPDSCIIIEHKSRNTHENAANTARKLTQLGLINEPILLITSAFHMPRAKACFVKSGLSVQSYCTDNTTRGKNIDPRDYINPDAYGLEGWNRLVKEWVGMVAYRVKGFV